MVITRSLEKTCTGQFRTVYFFAFYGSAPEPPELEPAEPGFGTKPAGPEQTCQTESNRTEIFCQLCLNINSQVCL